MWDNKIVVNSLSIIYGTLNKKHIYIAYNKAREAVAEVVISLKHMNDRSNSSSILNKALITHHH